MTPTPLIMAKTAPKPRPPKSRPQYANKTSKKEPRELGVEATLAYPDWYAGHNMREYFRAVEATLKEVKAKGTKVTYTAAYNAYSNRYTISLRLKNKRNSLLTTNVRGASYPIKFTTNPYTAVADHGREAPYELSAFAGVLDKVALANRTEVSRIETPITSNNPSDKALTNGAYHLHLKLHPKSGAQRRVEKLKRNTREQE